MRGLKLGLWFFPFILTRYRELDFKSVSERTVGFIFFVRPKKTNQKKAAPDDASMWLGFDFLMPLSDGPSLAH